MIDPARKTMDLSFLEFPDQYDFVTQSLIEIFGQDQLSEVLSDNEGKPPSGLPGLKKQISNSIGELITRGLLIRAGRAGFYYWMRKNSEDLGWKDTEFRLMPAGKKARKGMQDWLDWMQQQSNLTMEILDQGATYWVKVTGLTAQNSILNCDYFLGLIQELFSWAGSGRFFEVHESSCQLQGNTACLFVITKKSPD